MDTSRCETYPTKGIRTILMKFFGTFITFSSCAGLDNALIDQLSRPDAIHGAVSPTFASESLDCILIANSNNFTSDSLRRLVQVRNHAASKRLLMDPTSIGISRIKSLFVLAECPVLDLEDKAWF